MFQIAQEAGDGLVEDAAVHVVLFLEFEMTVPVDTAARGVGAVEELHKAHTALDKPPGEDAVLGKGGPIAVVAVRAVQLVDVRGFSPEAGGLGHGELHTRGEFVAGNARGEIGVAGKGRLRLGLQRAQGRPRGGVFLGGDVLGPLQKTNWFGAAKRRALKGGRQEAVSPVIRSALRHAARVLDGHECRQVLVFAAERVIDPSAHARETIEHKACVHEILRRPMCVGAVGKRMKKTQFIGQLNIAASATPENPCMDCVKNCRRCIMGSSKMN